MISAAGRVIPLQCPNFKNKRQKYCCYGCLIDRPFGGSQSDSAAVTCTARSSPEYRDRGLSVIYAVNLRGPFALEPARQKRATAPEACLLAPVSRKAKITDCLRRKLYSDVLGHGFDSRHLHQFNRWSNRQSRVHHSTIRFCAGESSYKSALTAGFFLFR